MTPEAEVCAALLQERFGPPVRCEVVSLESPPAALLPEEQALVARAGRARQREFSAGRACARQLLAELDFEPGPLLCSEDRLPLWPTGAIGSIAHDARRCAVAVARADPLLALGLDTEPDEPLELELWETICTPRELESLDGCAPDARGRRVRLLFSAKECVHKCLYPLTHAALELHDVEIELGPATGRFRARVRGLSSRGALEGFHFTYAGSIFTGAAWPSS